MKKQITDKEKGITDYIVEKIILTALYFFLFYFGLFLILFRHQHVQVWLIVFVCLPAYDFSYVFGSIHVSFVDVYTFALNHTTTKIRAVELLQLKFR